MIKKLRDIVERYPDDYEQKTKVGKSFVALHRDSKVVDKLGDKGGLEGQFRSDNVNTAEHNRAPQTGFPAPGEYNDYNLPTHYDSADSQEYEDEDEDDLPEYEFEEDDNDIDNTSTRSRIANGSWNVDEEEEINEAQPSKKEIRAAEKTLAHGRFRKKNKKEDGTSGQDRKSYSDTQDRKSYRVKEETELNELSSGKLGVYIHNASKPLPKKRQRGIDQAVDRLQGWRDTKGRHPNRQTPYKRDNEEIEQQSFLQHLDEQSLTRKHFREVAATVRQIEDPKKRSEYAQHHAAIFAKANPRFDAKRFFQAAGTLGVEEPKKK